MTVAALLLLSLLRRGMCRRGDGHFLAQSRPFRAVSHSLPSSMRPASSSCWAPSSWRMILVVVYVGAVAVLFLFVVMMLDVDFTELRQGMLSYLPVGGTIGADPAGRTGRWCWAPGRFRRSARRPRRSPLRPGVTNTEALGPDSLHEIRLLLPGGGSGAARRDDRRHRADASPQAGRQAPEHRRPGGAQARDRHRSPQGQAGAGDLTMTIGLAPLSHRRRHPLHHRHFRHLPQPQERHHHPDVDRTDAARGQHQFRRLSRPSSTIWWGRSSRSSC